MDYFTLQKTILAVYSSIAIPLMYKLWKKDLFPPSYAYSFMALTCGFVVINGLVDLPLGYFNIYGESHFVWLYPQECLFTMGFCSAYIIIVMYCHHVGREELEQMRRDMIVLLQAYMRSLPAPAA